MAKYNLVIGAGASNDINPVFGLGKDLLDQIQERVIDKNTPHQRYLSDILMNQLGIKYSYLFQFYHHLEEYRRRVKNPSIDEFLFEINSFPEFEALRADFNRIGIFCIMFHVLGWESEFAGKVNINEVPSWVYSIYQFLVLKDVLDSERMDLLRIVTFNYDRTLEYILFNLFYYNPKYKKSLPKIVEWINKNIVHVYGKIGSMPELLTPEQNKNKEKPPVPFGMPHRRTDIILKNMDNIHLIQQNRIIADKQLDIFIQSIRNTQVHNPTITEEQLMQDPNYRELGIFGFNFDYINCRTIALNNLSYKVKVKANIYPFIDDEFIYRREMTNKIRNMFNNGELHYYSCSSFVELFLNNKLPSGGI